MNLLNKVKERFVDLYYFLLTGRWPLLPNPKNLYTVILPVIPRFYTITEYNLRFLTVCDLTHCDQIIVVSNSNDFYAENMSVIKHYSNKVRIKYVVLPAYRKWLLRLNWVGDVIYISNVITAIKHSKTKYIYLHDADFFIEYKNHLEDLFTEMCKGDLNLISTYSRYYGKFPATYELLIKRDFITSRPPFTLFACNMYSHWHSTFTRFFISARNGNESLMNRNVGIHFKHLFCRFRAFEAEKGAFVDSKYSIFLLFILNSMSSFTNYKLFLFQNIDEYFNRVKLLKSAYLEEFEEDVRCFTKNSVITGCEREFLLSCLSKLKYQLNKYE